MKKKYKIIIIGLGTGAIFTAMALSKNNINDFLIIGKDGGNSYFSPWNMRVENPSELYKKLIQNLDETDKTKDRLFLLKYLSQNSKKDFLNLKNNDWKNINFTKTTFGYRPNQVKPGKKIFSILEKKYVKNKIIDEIKNIQFKNEEYVIKTNTKKIKSDILIIASGGNGRYFKSTTGETTQLTNLSDILKNLGAKYEDKGYMRHPFLVKDRNIPNALVSGYFVVNSNFFIEDVKTGELKKFLSEKIKNAIKNDDYHHLFPEMEKEFREASQKGKIIMNSNLSKKEYEKFVKFNEFGDVFAHKKYGSWLHHIEISTAVHYAIGGLKVDKNMKIQGLKNAFAIGEAVSLYGGRRMEGMGHIDSITLSKLIADNLLNKF